MSGFFRIYPIQYTHIVKIAAKNYLHVTLLFAASLEQKDKAKKQWKRSTDACRISIVAI